MITFIVLELRTIPWWIRILASLWMLIVLVIVGAEQVYARYAGPDVDGSMRNPLYASMFIGGVLLHLAYGAVFLLPYIRSSMIAAARAPPLLARFGSLTDAHLRCSIIRG